MPSIYDKFGTDADVESKGIVIDYGDGVRIRVARAGGSNKAYLRAIEKLSRKYRQQIQLDIISGDESAELFREIYADTIVLGWEGVTAKDGTPIPFSKTACVKLFEDLPDLFDDIFRQARRMDLFRSFVAETDAKN
jgi:hypothetical protein